jgi:hypothetical protein
MTLQVNIAEAKAKLSSLQDRALLREEDGGRLRTP